MQQLLDFIIVGSGFGGSVSALRLTEKGYSVAVIEQGKRWAKEDFAETNWDLRKFIWRPGLGLHGILQMTVTSDVFFLHGAGVGGGSLVYANTLIEPPAQAFDDPQWIGGRWQVDLAPYYTLAKRMLGAVVSPVIVHTDRVLKEVAEEMGRGDTFHAHDVGVYFGEPGITKADPFFDGKGPERTGCTLCGGCMVGCRVGAKNTLDQNYLYLAEKLGAMIVPEIKVIDIVPLGEGDPRSAPIDARANGSNGYELTIEKSMGLLKSRERVRTRGVVLSAGSFGTVDLLFRCKDRGTLPNVSDKLGDFVRTNSEALVGVVSKDKNVDYSKGIAITSGAFVDDSTHVEIVRYPAGSDAMALLTTPLTDDGPEMSRPVRWLKAIFANPGQAIRALAPFGWAKRTAILLVMQPVNNYLRYRLTRSWWWPFRKTLDTALVGGQKVPVYLPQANNVARRMAEKMNAVPQSGILEVLFGKATTAHILGGCPIGATEETGVVDPDHKLFGYENFYVADGSVIPANLGVNPSLTITAMSERAMAKVPGKEL
ncbi:MAG: GMC family oxidoreductase [Polyangiaceae bacterium]|nr:GMC family oxidoreductase [Polyangiaceae bacterium]